MCQSPLQKPDRTAQPLLSVRAIPSSEGVRPEVRNLLMPSRRRLPGQLAIFTTFLLMLLAVSPSAWAHTGLGPLKPSGEFDWQGVGAWYQWDFHPSIIIGITVLTTLYSLGNTVWRRKYGWSDQPATRIQVGLFTGAMLLLFFSLDGPLHHLADQLLFSAHMLQHMILQLIWAPMLVLAVPSWLWTAVLVRPKRIAPIAKLATRPAVAFLLYQGVIGGWHVPWMYNLALTQHNMHIVQHLLFMSTAVITWLVVLAPEPSLAASHPQRMVFIFGHMAAMKLLGLIISLSDHVLYTFYATKPQVFGLNALGDQQLGGMFMWLPGGSVLWLGLGRIWWNWLKKGTPPRGMTGIASLDAARMAQKASVQAMAEPATDAPE